MHNFHTFSIYYYYYLDIDIIVKPNGGIYGFIIGASLSIMANFKVLQLINQYKYDKVLMSSAANECYLVDESDEKIQDDFRAHSWVSREPEYERDTFQKRLERLEKEETKIAICDSRFGNEFEVKVSFFYITASLFQN